MKPQTEIVKMNVTVTYYSHDKEVFDIVVTQGASAEKRGSEWNQKYSKTRHQMIHSAARGALLDRYMQEGDNVGIDDISIEYARPLGRGRYMVKFIKHYPLNPH